ncbi:hypothetical protein HOY82DRAFT_651575 [Tuber indicum]|nr:hypothetical protein HOY82DRAFT_651575 [Tuber indicum]
MPPHFVTFLLASSTTQRKYSTGLRLRNSDRKTRAICLNSQPRNPTTPGLHLPRRAPSPSSRTGLSPPRLLKSTMASSSNRHSTICPRCLGARPTTTNRTVLASPPSLRKKLLRRRADRTAVASRPIMPDKRASPGRIRNVWRMPS